MSFTPRTDAGDLLLLAISAQAAGEYEKALALLRSAAVLDSNNAVIQHRMAVSLLLCGQPADAEAAARQAVELDPLDPDAHAILSMCLDCSYRGEASLPHAMASATLRRDGDSLRHLGAVFKDIGRFAEAEVVLREALSQFDDSTLETRHSLVELLLLADRYEEAITELATFEDQNTESYLSKRAQAMIGLGRLEEAEVTARECLRLFPASVHGDWWLGWVWLRSDRAEEALAVFEKLLAPDPQNPVYLGARAAALSALGRHAEAIATFERAVGIDPYLFETGTDFVPYWKRSRTAEQP